LVNLSSYQSYNILFNSLKQLPQFDTPGLSNIAGAYMTAKYGRSINSALSSDLNSVIKTFRSDTSNLNGKAKDLTAQADRVALSTRSGAVTGTTSQLQKTDNTIKIDQLATKQTNQSALLDSKQATSLASGTNTLKISSGNKSFTVSINVKAGESNSSVLSKTAKGINDLGGGFKARVATDNLGNQQLVVEAEKTGKNKGFAISGGLGSSLGLDKVSQAGMDAKFTYNGKDYQTESNSVTLDSGKTKLELKNTTTETVELDRSADTSGLEEKVTALASAYNTFQETLKASPDNKALQAISRQLDQMVTRSGSTLEQFGITKNAKGILEVDADKLKKGIAEKPDQARDLFVEKGSLSDKLQSKTEQLLRSPASTLIEIPKTATVSSPYQQINSGFLNQLNSTTQSSGNLFDMFL